MDVNTHTHADTHNTHTHTHTHTSIHLVKAQIPYLRIIAVVGKQIKGKNKKKITVKKHVSNS